MEFSDSISMAKHLVKTEAVSRKVYDMVMEAFGESPSVNQISKWRHSYKKSDADNKRRMPANFREIARDKTISGLMRYYKCKHETIKRWLLEAKTTAFAPPPHNFKPIPEDFTRIAPTKTKAELKRYYGIRYDKTLTRWLMSTGITPRKHVNNGNALSRMGRSYSPMNLSKLNTYDQCDEAADILRRERFPVNRCNENGSFNITGKFFRVGINVLTREELLAKAARYKKIAS